jgi:GGDEF domain-containing protein
MRNYYGPESVADFLADAGAFLKGSVRRLDIVCRMGEAGFAVLLPATGPTVSILKDRLDASLAQWLSERQAPSGPITAHIGCAVLPDECSGPDELRERAQPAAPPAPIRTLRPAA